MCGINGYLGNFPTNLITEMNQALKHRGPDADGAIHLPEEQLGLGHTRLSIIDLDPRSNQPMLSHSGNSILSYNGEIYNYRELRKELESEGNTFQTKSDTEVVLIGLEKHGEDFITKLNGIFAFAFFDKKKKELLIARDPLGVKPLYYNESRSGLIFSSELKALNCWKNLERDLNPLSVLNHLTYIWNPSPQSMFKSVSKLEPGHYLVVKEGKVITKKQYYDIPYGKKISNVSAEELSDQTFSAIETAVNRQLVADVEVGCFLSGGLDSSSLAYFASKNLPYDLQCFTIETNKKEMEQEGFADDLYYAKKVAKHLGSKLHIAPVQFDIMNELPKMIYSLDEPQADPAAINHHIICKMAKELGIKVLLSGTGGDDVFSGYRRHQAILFEKYWKHLPGLLRKGLKSATQSLPSEKATFRRIKKAFAYSNFPTNERIASYFNWIQPHMACELLNPEFLGDLTPANIAAPLLSQLTDENKFHSDLDKCLYLDSKYFLTDHNLNYADKMSMLEGVEVRVPFLDLDLVKFATTIPDKFRVKGGQAKWIFKKAMERALPHDIIYRPKTGFGVPLRKWIDNDLGPMINDLLSHDRIKRRGIFNPAAVDTLLKLHRSGKEDYAYTILSLMCIELWSEGFNIN